MFFREAVLANHAKNIPNSSQNHTEIIPKSCQNHPNIMPKSCQHHANIMPKSCQHMSDALNLTPKKCHHRHHSGDLRTQWWLENTVAKSQPFFLSYFSLDNAINTSFPHKNRCYTMISKAPDMKNNIFILPALQYIDFNVFLKVLVGKNQKIENPKNRKNNEPHV